MYLIRKYNNENSWKTANLIKIDQFRPETKDHRPETTCKILYNTEGLFLRFHIKDRYVRCIAKNYQDSVCQDSCVEFFVEPAGKAAGYNNFEFSGNGTMLAYHVIDPTRLPKGFAKFAPLDAEVNELVKRTTTLSKIVDPEITEPVEWDFSVFIPFKVFEKSHGIKPPVPGDRWRANLYKCGDKTSHPHWASWQPIGALNFHLPEYFGEIGFE